MLGKLNENEIDVILSNNFLGRLGCHDGDKTYVVPVNYVYDGKDIIAHSVIGMKIEMMRNNPNVCFEVDEIIDFSNWKSVILWGEYQEITDPLERYRAIKYFDERTLRVKISETALAAAETYEMQKLNASFKPIIYRIIILEKTGRYERD